MRSVDVVCATLLCVSASACNAIFGLDEGSPRPGDGAGAMGSGGDAGAAAGSGGTGATGGGGATGGLGGTASGGSGAGGGGAGAGGTGSCYLPALVTSACHDCFEGQGLREECCPAIAACEATKECVDYLSCLTSKPGDCEAEFPDGAALTNAIATCIADSPCGAACVGYCGGFSIPGPATVPNLACAACFTDTCCPEHAACAMSAACQDCVTNGSSCDLTDLDDAVTECEANCPC